MSNDTATEFLYIVDTVNSWRLRSTTVVTGTDAQMIAEEFIAKGYVAVEVAPAAPVNGFTDAVAGIDYRAGDTANIDTRKGA